MQPIAKTMKKPITVIACLLLFFAAAAQTIVETKAGPQTFRLSDTYIYTDAGDDALVSLAAELLKKDIAAVTGKAPALTNSQPVKAGTAIIIGSVNKSGLIQSLIKNKKIKTGSISGKWEAYTIQTISNPFTGVANAIIIAGSDRRGTAFGVFELSKQLGISPWYWWADVPVKKQADVHIKKNVTISDAPQV